jgi:hypothetical protein
VATAQVPTLDLLPKVYNLALYAGDGVALRLNLSDKTGAALQVDGEITAQIRTTRSEEDPSAEFTADLSEGDEGIVVLRMSGAETAALMNGSDKFAGVWDLQWTPSDDEPRTLVQGKVSCQLDVTRP